MRNIHLFWCQRGNLEAVRVSPSPTPALTGTEPGYRHIHQHTFQEQISRNVGNTYKSHNQYCGHLNWTWGVSGAGKYFEREQSKCLFYLLAFLIPVVLKMWHLSPVVDGGGSDRRALKHSCCSESHGEKQRSILPTVLTRVCVITFSLRPNTWDLQCSRHVEVFVGLE